MSELVAYVDGGSHGSPGPSGIGVVIEKPDGERVRIAKWIGHQDNNVAEYAALLEALQCALELEATSLHVYSDSEIVVKQMTGEYACRSPRLYSLNWTCRKLARSLKFAIAHIPRDRNLEANRLANQAVRGRVATYRSSRWCGPSGRTTGWPRPDAAPSARSSCCSAIFSTASSWPAITCRRTCSMC